MALVPRGSGGPDPRPDARPASAWPDYMPASAAGVKDPYAHTMQWSRRFIGLKVFLSLLVAGWEGYAAAIRHQTAMGRFLRRALTDRSWKILNPGVDLPVVCFADAAAVTADGGSFGHLDAICRDV